MLLEQFFDANLKVNTDQPSSELVAEELARIQSSAARILIAAEIPRRIGSDATDDELAAEKRRCKRVLHVLRQQLLSWAEGDPDKIQFREITPADRKEGAALDWNTWWEDQRIYLDHRRTYIATYGLKKPDSIFAKKAVTRLSTEISHMSYAMR